ncbi:hypothetical protein [Sphingomonas sp. dw_22]|uniref:hypothetical protein n=1 Tax=Sphingomonas sp. dw_22 TaxID=2721175 RepID=UPI001BD357E6|nr:hypothetical protein [Sphingomonas sp. dw_22]
MRIWIGIAAAALCIATAAAAQSAGGQVVLENNTSVAADLYVDGVYQCTAPAHSDCLAEVDAGGHVATIRFPDGDFIVSDGFDVPADRSVTLPVVDLMA